MFKMNLLAEYGPEAVPVVIGGVVGSLTFYYTVKGLCDAFEAHRWAPPLVGFFAGGGLGYFVYKMI